MQSINKYGEALTPPIPATDENIARALAKLKKTDHLEIFDKSQVSKRKLPYKTPLNKPKVTSQTHRNREKRARKKRLGK